MSKFRDSTLGSIVVLAVICLIVTAALAGTHAVTAPIIEKQQAEAIAEALQLVLPEGDSFTEVQGDFPREIQEVYTADNGAGSVFVASTSGYGGPMTFVIGINGDGAVTGIDVQNHSETKGFGTRVAEPEYLDTLTGATSAESVDSISGVTVTSNALKTALEHCLEISKTL